MVRRHFGMIPARRAPPGRTGFTAQTAERTDSMTDPQAQLPGLPRRVAHPRAAHARPLPLEVLGAVLGMGEARGSTRTW